MPELAYSIDKNQSDATQTLVIKIEQVEKEGFAFKFQETTRPLYASMLRKLAVGADSAAIAHLTQEELKFQKITTGRTLTEVTTPFSSIHISYSQSLLTLKLLAATGKLFFNQRQLVCDFFTPATYYNFIEPAQEGYLTLTGRIKTAGQDFSIRECSFICKGPPIWFIKGIGLKILTTDISWKNVKQSHEQPFCLPAEKLRALLPDEKDEHFSKIVFDVGTTEVVQKKREPLPILFLKDRVGAFADLWMDYGEGCRIAFHDHDPHVKDSKSKTVCKRLLEAERAWEKDLLETNFMRKQTGTSYYYCPVDKVAKSLLFLLELGWQLIDWKGNRIIHQSAMELSLQATQHTILVNGKINYDAFQANLSDVIGAFNRKERFVQLASGFVGLLPNSWEQTGLNGVIEEGEIIGGGLAINKNRFGLLSELLDSQKNVEIDSSLSELGKRLQSFQGLTTAKSGPDFQGQLRDYQQEGLNWLAFLYDFGFHGILADDMGLGKTVQVLAFLSQMHITAPILIVLPTSLLFNWKREIERFLPSWKTYVHHGATRSKEEKNLPSSGIILTSYTTLRLDLPYFLQTEFQCVILDEAQAIKNSHTHTAGAVFKLKAQFRLSITGTPIENHLNEIWSHFRFLIPNLLGTEKEFEGELQAATGDSRHLQRIKKKIRPFVLRRKKEEVAKDLPERIEQVVWVEMNVEQRRVYDDFLAGVKGNLFKKVEVGGMSQHRMEIFEAILRLRQICCHPLLVTAQIAESNPETLLESAKLGALLQDIETAIEEGRKAIVYSQFTSMLSLIGKALKERGWRYAYLDGGTINREKVVQQFQEEADTPLFLISLKAGGIGLNLTAADYVFLYDPWWNEAVEDQAISRAHRIGRQQTVIAKRYVAIESIEEKMMKLKLAKRSLVNDILDGEMANTNLSEEDFRFLLS